MFHPCLPPVIVKWSEMLCYFAALFDAAAFASLCSNISSSGKLLSSLDHSLSWHPVSTQRPHSGQLFVEMFHQRHHRPYDDTLQWCSGTSVGRYVHVFIVLVNFVFASKGKADDLYRGSMQFENHRRTALQYPPCSLDPMPLPTIRRFYHEGPRKVPSNTAWWTEAH